MGGDRFGHAGDATEQRVGVGRNARTLEFRADTPAPHEHVDERERAGSGQAERRRMEDEAENASGQDRGADQQKIEPARRAHHDLREHQHGADHDQSPVDETGHGHLPVA
jgi:hypothetical protein